MPEIRIKENEQSSSFDVPKVLKDLKFYLPAQAPLKDFIFQNSLQSFLSLPFNKALSTASEIFGYKVFLSLAEFRTLYQAGKINDKVLDRILTTKKEDAANQWKVKLLNSQYDNTTQPRIGQIKANWRKQYKIDLDSLVHPTLFRMVCSYLDQGISIWNFPIWNEGFILSVKHMEHDSFTSFFKSKRARSLLLEGNYQIEKLLSILVGDESLYTQYLFDQQFAHPGWSGMVSVIEEKPETLMDKKKISLKELIILELLLEIDALDAKLGSNNWSPLATNIKVEPIDLFADVPTSEQHEIQAIWQEAYEWTYYDEVLVGLGTVKILPEKSSQKSFQSMFCIDDRETSLRDYLEKTDPNCETYATPGFFNVEFYFQPEHGKAYTKLCPAPVTPKFLIKEIGTHEWKEERDVHLAKPKESLFAGMIISPALGFWSAIKLAISIFRPSMSPATASSFKHMDRVSKLTIENTNGDQENGLQVGFTVEEMAMRVEGLLRSIGLVKDFASIVYVIGHGASSVNNPFYATMDCGACSCRPGSVNSRAFCFMANHPKVRKTLTGKGLVIPDETQFLGGLHDTTRDEIVYYDELILSEENKKRHFDNQQVFEKALLLNGKERSRRFESIDTKLDLKQIHEQILNRSVSLFEPRPELDHANNALTIVGRRDMTIRLFLDRRAFMNSYDYRNDLDGKYLSNIMKPIAPVCGGINLSYYFSRVDNKKLGAGTKLPHNVMGLFGVANGIDGDLRPGLPSQMVETHDPIRQLVIVEHFPEIVLEVVNNLPTYDWFKNQWMYLIVIHPETRKLFVFKNGSFVPYEPLHESIGKIADITPFIESSKSKENIPVYLIS